MVLSIIPFPKVISFALQYLYPLLGTINVMLSFEKQDISTFELTAMLFYWIICGFIFMLERIASVITIVPFYYDLKIVALLWLTLPVFSGSGYIYYMYIHEQADSSFESHLFKISQKFQALKSGLLELSKNVTGKKLTFNNRKMSKIYNVFLKSNS